MTLWSQFTKIFTFYYEAMMIIDTGQLSVQTLGHCHLDHLHFLSSLQNQLLQAKIQGKEIFEDDSVYSPKLAD